MIEDLIRKNRTCRRFYQNHSISADMLKGLVNLGRLSASAANLQPLKYVVSRDPEKNGEIFRHLAWAGYLRDWKGPNEGERPSAYIIVLGDTEITKNFGCDHGIASQSILLGAREQGLAGCMIESIDREKLRAGLEIPERYKILLVIALGKPKEKVVVETIKPGDSIKYWRDEKGIHHVPKRDLNDVILNVC